MRGLESRQQGFSLIEVLVTLAIVSMGLLGIVSLQTHTQKVSSNAYFHTQAVIITHDMVERIRANSIASYSQQYHLKQAQQVAHCRNKMGCNSRSMVQNDLFEWQEMIQQQLPLGVGIVCIDSTPNDGDPSDSACDSQGRYYAVKIWWHDSVVNKIQRSTTMVSTE